MLSLPFKQVHAVNAGVSGCGEIELEEYQRGDPACLFCSRVPVPVSFILCDSRSSGHACPPRADENQPRRAPVPCLYCSVALGACATFLERGVTAAWPCPLPWDLHLQCPGPSAPSPLECKAWVRGATRRCWWPRFTPHLSLSGSL